MPWGLAPAGYVTAGEKLSNRRPSSVSKHPRLTARRNPGRRIGVGEALAVAGPPVCVRRDCERWRIVPDFIAVLLVCRGLPWNERAGSNDRSLRLPSPPHARS